jgi:hypothetical protein
VPSDNRDLALVILGSALFVAAAIGFTMLVLSLF